MKSILVIENDLSILENTVEILELEHYLVYGCANGQEGIEKARESKPDLILCDIGMPIKDGWEVLQELRCDPGIGKTPFIFLTAYSEKIQKRKGLEMGANGYLIKPFFGEELLEMIQTQLYQVTANNLNI
jgi:CheY-like chemotaxis protein